MSAPRLAGPRVALVPVPQGVAAAVVEGDAGAIAPRLAAVGLRAAAGWPHEQTAGALGGASVGAGDRTWLVVVDGEVVGECGWKGPPDPDGAVEVGYALAPAARGAGVGTEAVALLVAWSERQPGVRALTADVLVGNDGSRRLLRRLGFVERPLHGSWLRAERGELRLRGRHVC